MKPTPKHPNSTIKSSPSRGISDAETGVSESEIPVSASGIPVSESETRISESEIPQNHRILRHATTFGIFSGIHFVDRCKSPCRSTNYDVWMLNIQNRKICINIY